MTRIKVQYSKPKRTCTDKFSNYRKYKDPIQGDFGKKCGYCDDLDFYMGGKSGYHIDHFKPKKHYPDLETEYSNLVYSCPFCNIAKSDKWRDKEGFIDPCLADYDEHLYRDDQGKICHSSPRGEYIYRNLKLSLRRHQVIWLVEKLERQKIEVKSQIELLKDDDSLLEMKVLKQFYEIQKAIDQYLNFFREG